MGIVMAGFGVIDGKIIDYYNGVNDINKKTTDFFNPSLAIVILWRISDLTAENLFSVEREYR